MQEEADLLLVMMMKVMNTVLLLVMMMKVMMLMTMMIFSRRQGKVRLPVNRTQAEEHRVVAHGVPRSLEGRRLKSTAWL